MYKIFKRSATSFNTFSSARKITIDTHLTEAQAREMCHNYNDNRTARQIRKGTKLEYTKM